MTAPNYEAAWKALSEPLSWMHDNPRLKRYWGWGLAEIANDLIDRAYPGLRVAAPDAAASHAQQFVQTVAGMVGDEMNAHVSIELHDAARAIAAGLPPVYPSLELCIQFSDDGQRIRKWSRLPFDGGECLYSHPTAPDAAASREPDPVWLNDPASLDGGAPDAAAIRPDSWTATPEDVREQVLLLAEVELHLQSCRVFLTTREKMHPCGVDLHDELLAKVTAAIETIGREKANG